MDYKELYEQALERAVKLRDDLLKNGTLATAKGVESIFPELAESEDERIRKGLIEYFLHYPDHDITYYDLKSDSVISWLEKQGEQKPADNKMKALLRTEYEKGRADAIEEMQNPAWSAGDETVLNNLIWTLKEDMILTSDRDTYTSWLKSLKERVQPKQEWSEEDELTKNALINLVEMYYGGCIDKSEKNRLLNFLKSLKDRYTWKPSDEQMEYLAKAILTLGNEGDNKTSAILYELRTDLKKLKG